MLKAEELLSQGLGWRKHLPVTVMARKMQQQQGEMLTPGSKKNGTLHQIQRYFNNDRIEGFSAQQELLEETQKEKSIQTTVRANCSMASTK